MADANEQAFASFIACICVCPFENNKQCGILKIEMMFL